MSKLFLSLVIMVITISCTKNTRTRVWGGEQTILLQPNERLQNITWKDSDLWLLTKRDTTKPVEYTFKEDSKHGIFEGQITIIEQ